MTKSVAVLTALALAGISIAATTPAHAVTWNWTISGHGETGSGTLTTSSETCSGGCAIDTFIGLLNGQSITGLNDSYQSPSNLLYYPASSPFQIDQGGTAFDFAGGPGIIYLFRDSFDFFYSSRTGNVGPISFDATPVPTTPLPTTLPLFATGLGALGLLGWRRKRETSPK
jgi:hypothetical protein